MKLDSSVSEVEPPIYIAVIDNLFSEAQDLVQDLIEFNFDAQAFASFQVINLDIQQRVPDLVIIGQSAIDRLDEEAFSLAKTLYEQGIPCFLYLTHDDFYSRLKSVRSHFKKHYVKPLELTRVVNHIRDALKLDSVSSYKICLVDDQTSVLNYLKLTLESQGLEVFATTNPTVLIREMQAFEPDIFIFDINMPEISGIELAHIIRQFEDLSAVPIIFLTGDNSLENKLMAINGECDDLLPKSLPIEAIVTQIESRIKRSVNIRKQTMQDSLTGLLNHKTIVACAMKAFDLYRQVQMSTSIVMIDLDNFKQVNDTYGHAAGDKVIIAISQLLKGRLRKTDKIGRYGGEEFMLVLKSDSHEQQMQRLNQIRESFSHLVFQHDEATFSVTFSAGWVRTCDFQDFTLMCQAADHALYQAKKEGKNIICIGQGDK